MEFSVKTGTPEKQRTACVVVGIFESRKLSAPAQVLDDASGGFISHLIQRGECEGKLGQTLLIHNVPHTLCDRVLLVGCGAEKEFDTKAFHKVNAAVAKFLDDKGATEAFSYLTKLPVKHIEDMAWKVRHAVRATEDALYHFDQLKSKKKDAKQPLKHIVFSVSNRRDVAEAEQAIHIGQAIASGMKLTKDLANLPGNICTPTYLAEQAKGLQKKHRSLKVNVLEQKDMEQLGMGSLLSVARGSRQPPKLITLEYKGGVKSDKPIVLVGKGVTFDSGGISLKPGAAMDEMKFDMCGAASVLGTLSACAELKLPINVVGVIPATENLPDGQATKPGDIVTSMAGITIEILNTDAEGRLILCDALEYAKKFNPAVVIDIATLTGACVIALGAHPAGLMGNHHPLIHDLLKAGTVSGDRCWELPLWDDYQEQLDSNFADIANIGGKEAGAITAGCFLSRFTKKYHWAHLDIAGVAWKSGKDNGATGRPVPLLMQFILDKLQTESTK
ncbi:MAG: leucyl aminopeptidase [Pseudomonadota bacterium]|nr:leucyl aminopeptidase [Pseudomonadota bacterium]